MKLVSIDSVLSEQALITGRLRDALTLRPLDVPFQVLLYYTIPPDPLYQLYPLAARVLPGGLFVFPGDPQRTFPRLGSTASLALRVQVSADGYQNGLASTTLTAAALVPAAQPIPAGGLTGTGQRLAAPLFVANLDLQPRPVALSGRVVRIEDLNTGLFNAQVSITSPAARGPVATNTLGFFYLADLPVAAALTVQVTHPLIGAPRTFPLFPNFRQPVNQQTFVIR